MRYNYISGCYVDTTKWIAYHLANCFCSDNVIAKQVALARLGQLELKFEPSLISKHQEGWRNNKPINHIIYPRS